MGAGVGLAYQRPVRFLSQDEQDWLEAVRGWYGNYWPYWAYGGLGHC